MPRGSTNALQVRVCHLSFREPYLYGAADDFNPYSFTEASKDAVPSFLMDRRIRKVVQLLETQWRNGIRVSDLAAQVGLGTSRLEHLFKSEAQVSIRAYILERRLIEAAAMLSGTEERISAISYSVGFRDPSNFNHAFKKRFGVSPRDYRANISSASDQAKADRTN